MRQPGKSRLKSFGYKIPREEIDALWSIMGFSSCCTDTNNTKNFKETKSLLSGIVSYECGTLPSADPRLPPPKMMVDTCSKELKWICTLLSSRLLGEVPKMDPFVKQIIERSVMSEAFDAALTLLPTAPRAKVINTAVQQLWGYSCIAGSSVELESDLQAGLMDLVNKVYCLTPSSVLLQQCVSLTDTYSKMTMTKNVRWKDFRTMLESLSSTFVEKALEIEAKSERSNPRDSQNRDAFAEMFSAIDIETEIKIVESTASSHLRAAACHLMLAGVVARSRYNVPGDGNNFHLNKAFRERVSSFISFIDFLI